MKDLDFDELDRAVNSLISTTPASDNTASDEPKEKVLDLGDAPISQPSLTVPVVIPPVPPVVAKFQATPRPSTGRFMDVVHPSSNMRSSTVMPDRLTRPSIAPIPVGRPMVSPNFSNTSVSPAPKIAAAPTVNSWPTASDNDDADIDQISNDISKAMEDTSIAPMTSPFLPDAKVEKRPLGAFSSDLTQPSAVEDVSAESSAGDTTVNNEQSDILQKLNNNNVAALPDELQSNLLKIEANDITPESDQIESPSPLSVSQQISEEPEESEITQVTLASSSTTEAPVINNPQPVAATSIPQQYTEQPSSGDQKTGSIYDTNSYHKALAPTKKKSGWLWVLWIVLLLIIGAGSGAAVYFLVLPNL